MAFQWVSLLFFVFCANSIMHRAESYANIESLKSIAKNISIMFKDLQPIDSRSQIDTHQHSMKIAMMEIIDQIACYDHPTVKLDHLLNVSSNKENNRDNNGGIMINIFDHMKYINEEYEAFKETARSIEILDEMNLPIVSVSLMQTGSMLSSGKIHKLAHPDGQLYSRSFIPQILINMKLIRTSSKLCNDFVIQPEQYIIFNIFLSLVSHELKAFANEVLGSYYHYAIHRNISYTKLCKKMGEKYAIVARRLEDYHELMKFWVSLSGLKMQKCDAKILERGINFVELDGVFRKIITSNHLTGGSSCLRKCEDLNGQLWMKEKCNNNRCESCNGLIRNCRNGLEPLFFLANLNISRRFEWIDKSEVNNGIHFNSSSPSTSSGSEIRNFSKNCSYDDREKSMKKESLYPCQFCICTCEQNTYLSTNSTFIISSQLMEADTKENMVVTGLKFVEKDRIIYIQLKQGKLMPGGWIDKGTDKWKPIEHLDRKNISGELRTKKETRFENFIVVGNTVKSVNLDSLTCPSAEDVVTGVGLKMSGLMENANHIVLFIQCRAVNLKRGIFLPFNETGPIENLQPRWEEVKTGWLPPDKVQESFEERKLNGQTSSSNQYVTIKMSDKGPYSNQSVAPWFDAQNITSEPSVALAGVGLYYRNRRDTPNTFGLLSFQLISFNYSNLM